MNKCAACCIEKTVSLSSEDVERIGHYYTNTKFFRVRNTGVKIMNWKEHNDKKICIFLNPNTYKCDIYDVRPQVCKEFFCNQTIGGVLICHQNLTDAYKS